MEIIDWLVLNSGMIILFIIVVGIAIPIGWYVYSRKRLLKTTNEPEHINKPEKPEIVIFLRPHASCVQCLMLCIENIGTLAAHDVQFNMGTSAAPFITSSSNFGDARLFKKNNFLREGVRCFGAGQKIEQFLINLIEELPEELKEPFQISVTYTNSQNHPYENRYVLDFGDFETLRHIDSRKEKAIPDLRPLLDVIQTGFSQVAENIERIRPPQPAGPESSENLSEKPEEPPQSVQSEQAKSLPPGLKKFVDLYNTGNADKLQKAYASDCSIHVSNEAERLQRPNVPPIFQTTSDGSFVAHAIGSENLYAVVPFSGCILQKELYISGAFGEVFECPGFDPEYTYHVKVIRPALFKRDPVNEKWKLEEKGELELTERDN